MELDQLAADIRRVVVEKQSSYMDTSARLASWFIASELLGIERKRDMIEYTESIEEVLRVAFAWAEDKDVAEVAPNDVP